MSTSVRSILRVQAKPGMRDALIAFYKENRIIEIAVERGLSLGGELLVPHDPDAPLVVTCVWPHRRDYETWVATRPAIVETLADIVDVGAGGLPAGDLLDIETTTYR